MRLLILGILLTLPTLAFAHGGGLNPCGCHFNRKTGECHCHQDRGCGCECQETSCDAPKEKPAKDKRQLPHR